VWLRVLRLEDFRNYERLELELGEGLNFFFGPNGTGKTSILEAVSFLAVARSLRGSSDSEVVRWGQQAFGVGGEVVSDGISRGVVLRYARGGGKEVTIDGEPLPKLSDMVGVLRVAWFCPEDTWITKGGPAARRRLVDLTLCQIAPAYLTALLNYRRALRQRNEALLAWSPDEESERIVEVWTDRLVKYGSTVLAERLALVPRLSEAVSGFQSLVASDEALSLTYRSTIALDGGQKDDCGKIASDATPDEETVAARYCEELARRAEDERRRGFTLVGPHRDDLVVKLNGRVLRSFGSQGQHRTAAIALKLGEAAVLNADGKGVVVLLDDILSELDERRAAALVELVGSQGQALMTSTRRVSERFAGAGPCTSFRVEAGEVVRQ
jgi:DNA replication and repair protein RecF